jgi:hypothetical protein
VAELSKEEQDELALVMRCFRHSTKTQEKRQEKYIDRYRAFRGVLERAEDQWQSQLSPPYIFQIIETIYSMIAGEHPRSQVLPQGEKDIAGALALDKLLPIQRKNDAFDEKYAQWVKQALVLGASPGKIGWESKQRLIKRRQYDELTGVMSVVEQEETVKDQPTFSNIDASDFFWDPSASRMDQASWVIARWWVTLESIKQDKHFKNVEMLKDAPRGYGGASPMKDEAIVRDKDKLVELLEYWDRGRLIVVANRSIVLRSEPMPLWHGKLPFIMATPVPDLYSMEGISEVELLKDIQAAIWSFLNQRLDNTRLISNAIVMIRDTMDDPDKLVFEPGAIWEVSDPQEVMMWTPNQNITQASLEAEQELKSDLLNLTGAMQYLGGAAPEEMSNNTATGISIMSNNAMNRVLTKRQRIYDALREKGDQEISLIQQLQRDPVEIRLPGTSQDVPYRFERITPQQLLCDCYYDIEDATESMNRQERRQDSLMLFQTVFPMFQIAPTLGVMLNPQPFIEDILDAFDKKNPEAYISPMATPPGQVAPGEPNLNGAPGPGGTPPNGGPPEGLAQLIPGLQEALAARAG